jgi:hypothetical protein
MSESQVWKYRFKDEWLVSKVAVKLFFVSTLFVLALTPAFLGRLDTSTMSFGMRLPWAIVGFVGPFALFFLWFGMWRYWLRLDESGLLVKRFWLVILLVGFWYGACLYYLFGYVPQVAKKVSLRKRD